MNKLLWLVKNESVPANGIDMIITKVHGWNGRKAKLMKPEDIKITIEHLREQNWI